MDYTQNYHLPQWVETDRILMDDFNEAYSAIAAALDGHDTALSDLQAADTALETSLAAKGDCSLYTTSYAGTGTSGASNPSSLTFPARPKLVVICQENIIAFLVPDSRKMLILYAGGIVTGVILNTSNTNTLSWYSGHPDYQMNYSGKTYHVVALISAA